MTFSPTVCAQCGSPVQAPALLSNTQGWTGPTRGNRRVTKPVDDLSAGWRGARVGVPDRSIRSDRATRVPSYTEARFRSPRCSPRKKLGSVLICLQRGLMAPRVHQRSWPSGLRRRSRPPGRRPYAGLPGRVASPRTIPCLNSGSCTSQACSRVHSWPSWLASARHRLRVGHQARSGLAPPPLRL